MEKGTEKLVPNVLSIAGVDPSGGAGILADVKAFSACGCYGMAVITALTAQNTCSVSGVQMVATDFVRLQLQSVFQDIEVHAVKIGMLGTARMIRRVADILRRHAEIPIVLDPVMVAKSGDRLLSADAITAMREELLPLATVVTPNLPEACTLFHRPEITSREEMPALFAKIYAQLPATCHLYLKGGHLHGDNLIDCYGSPEQLHRIRRQRIHTKNTHGTGCTLSSAIAAYLAHGYTYAQAFEAAQAYIYQAIIHADHLNVGHGHGPTHHFWKK